MIERRIRKRAVRRSLPTGIVLVATFITVLACEREVSSLPQSPSAAVDTSRSSARNVTDADTALRYPVVPDPSKTPGAALEVTAADICVPGYSKKVRNVTAAVKRQAYAKYGVRTHQPGEYEVDHLISLELGGSNSIRNLWPQSFRTHPWNAYVKDALENELHRRVCAGTIDLAKAQRVIASNWVIGYRAYVHPNPPPPHTRGKARARQRAAPSQQAVP
jgi:hypothetical protein